MDAPVAITDRAGFRDADEFCLCGFELDGRHGQFAFAGRCGFAPGFTVAGESNLVAAREILR